MTRLEDISLGRRIILTVAIVIVVLLLLALFGWLSGRWEEAQAEGLPPSKWDDRMIALDKEALDEAYRTQIQHLFSVWMRDETGQPGRAVVGARQARRAYIEVMAEVEKREKR